MSDLLEHITQVGFDIIGMKYFGTGVQAIYFYDCLLTLEDEIEYAWKGKKTWLFYMFLLNRYIPMIYALWTRVGAGLLYPEWLCKRTAILGLVFFVWVTFAAQVFLIARIFALTRRNRMVTGFFVLLTLAQLTLGGVFFASPDNTAIKLPEIKLEPYYVCIFTSNTGLESAYTSLSLAFDFCAFISVVVYAQRSVSPPLMKALRFTGIIGTIVRDATIYFAMIFTSHITLVAFIFFARDSLRLTPAAGINLFLPMMVSRLFLSLKKSANPSKMVEWRVDHFTCVETGNSTGIEFGTQPVGKPPVDNESDSTMC